MDQNDVPMQPNTASGYEYSPNVITYNPTGHVNIGSGNEYTPGMASYNPQTATYYSNDTIPTYTNTETIVDSSMATDCNVVPTNYEYVPSYLAPANFYGNSSYNSSQYQKVDEGSYAYSHYGQDMKTDSNVYSNSNNIPTYIEPAHDTIVENKSLIVSDVCVEETKIEVKAEEPEPMEESHSFAQSDVLVEHTTVTVNHEEESPQEEKEGPREGERIEESQDVCRTQAHDIVQNTETSTVDENTNQSISNGNVCTETVIQNIQMCIRSGCGNQAINNPEWEQEFCSNDCVILHCKNVFNAWVKSNQIVIQ